MSKVEQRQGRIPAFTSLEDEAAFWESHSLSEFEDNLETIEAEVARPLVHRLTADLEREGFRRLAAVARQQGLAPTALACRWVLEALEQAEAEQDHAPALSKSPD